MDEEIQVIYSCDLCSFESDEEDEVYWHIDTEHTKEELIEQCISRDEIMVDWAEF